MAIRLWAAALLLGFGSAQAAPITLDLSGTVTSIAGSFGGLVGIGERLAISVTLEDSTADNQPGDTAVGQYNGAVTGLVLTLNDYRLVLDYGDVEVGNDIPGSYGLSSSADYFTIYGYTNGGPPIEGGTVTNGGVSYDFFLAELSVWDETASMLSSDALISNGINLRAVVWGGGPTSRLVFEGNGGQAEIGFNIDKVSVGAPPTFVLMALLMGLALRRRLLKSMAAAMLVFAPLANAAVIDFSYTGEVTSVDPLLSTVFASGDALTLDYSVETTTPVSETGSDGVRYGNAITSLSLSLPGYNLSTIAGGSSVAGGSFVEIGNNVEIGPGQVGDSLTIRSYSGDSSVLAGEEIVGDGGVVYPFIDVYLGLVDSSGTVFSSSALSGQDIALENFSPSFMALTFNNTAYSEPVHVQFSLHDAGSSAAVNAPSAWALMVLMLGFVTRRRGLRLLTLGLRAFAAMSNAMVTLIGLILRRRRRMQVRKSLIRSRCDRTKLPGRLLAGTLVLMLGQSVSAAILTYSFSASMADGGQLDGEITFDTASTRLDLGYGVYSWDMGYSFSIIGGTLDGAGRSQSLGAGQGALRHDDGPLSINAPSTNGGDVGFIINFDHAIEDYGTLSAILSSYTLAANSEVNGIGGGGIAITDVTLEGDFAGASASVPSVPPVALILLVGLGFVVACRWKWGGTRILTSDSFQAFRLGLATRRRGLRLLPLGLLAFAPLANASVISFELNSTVAAYATDWSTTNGPVSPGDTISASISFDSSAIPTSTGTFVQTFQGVGLTAFSITVGGETLSMDPGSGIANALMSSHTSLNGGQYEQELTFVWDGLLSNATAFTTTHPATHPVEMYTTLTFTRSDSGTDLPSDTGFLASVFEGQIAICAADPPDGCGFVGSYLDSGFGPITASAASSPIHAPGTVLLWGLVFPALWANARRRKFGSIAGSVRFNPVARRRSRPLIVMLAMLLPSVSVASIISFQAQGTVANVSDPAFAAQVSSGDLAMATISFDSAAIQTGSFFGGDRYDGALTEMSLNFGGRLVSMDASNGLADGFVASRIQGSGGSQSQTLSFQWDGLITTTGAFDQTPTSLLVRLSLPHDGSGNLLPSSIDFASSVSFGFAYVGIGAYDDFPASLIDASFASASGLGNSVPTTSPLLLLLLGLTGFGLIKTGRMQSSAKPRGSAPARGRCLRPHVDQGCEPCGEQ